MVNGFQNYSEVKEHGLKYFEDLHNTFQNTNILLSFDGEFSQETVKSTFRKIENSPELWGNDEARKRRMINIMIECVQNICKYAEDFDKQIAPYASFQIGEDEDAYIILTGNFVTIDKIAQLKTRFNHLNSLDEKGLRKLYKELCLHSKINEKGGAGLGFIDIARRTPGEKILYDFKPVNNIVSLFIFQVKLKKHEN